MTGPTVYVVDDDPSVARTICAAVESVGLAAQPFGSAEELLNAETRAHPQCLILDIRLPGISGLDLLERLRADGNATPVIMMSGESQPSAALQAGAMAFLKKPFDLNALIARVQDAFSHEA